MSEQNTQSAEAAAGGAMGLAPASVAMIERYLRQRHRPPVWEPLPDEAALVGYLLGEGSSDALQTLERRLARDPSARALLRRVDSALESIRRLTWDDVVQLASADRTGTDTVVIQVARVWQRRLERQMRLSPASLSRYLKDFGGWSGSRGDDSQDENRPLAWSTLHSALQQSLKPSVERPVFAVVRGARVHPGARSAIQVVGLPSHFSEVDVEMAEMTQEGALQVKVNFRLSAEHKTSVPRRPERVRLQLTAAGQEWLLGESMVSGQFAEWNIPQMGASLGIASGPLDLSRLTLKFGRALRRHPALDPASSVDRPAVPTTVTAAVIDSNGRQNRTPSVLTLPMPDAPTFQAGRLHLTIGLPSAARSALAAYRLNVDIAVTPERSQRLGSFPVNRWSDDGAARVLEIPWPGGGASKASAEIALLLLQISLQAGAGSRVGNPEI